MVVGLVVRLLIAARITNETRKQDPEEACGEKCPENMRNVDH